MALRKTGLHDALMTDVDEKGEPSAFTVFAPTDRAFEHLDTNIRMKIVNGDSCTLSKYLYKHLPRIDTKASINLSSKYCCHRFSFRNLNIKEKSIFDNINFF